MKKMICKPATMDAAKEEKKSTTFKTKAPAKQKKKAQPQEEAELSSGIGTLVALEPRIMFDGAALATGAEVLQEPAPQDQTPIPGIDGETSTDSSTTNMDDALWSSGLTLSAPFDRKEIVFIDTSVDDYQTLMEGINPNAEVILLDSTRDGIEQIAEILGDRSDIDAIHIISHGDQGELYLGTGTLSMESMQGEYADELATINQALTEEADFLIYGCNFGEGESGNEAASLLAELTGADIAASIDDTGSAKLGGDWELEYTTGSIESDVVVGAEAQQNWSELLAQTIHTSYETVTNESEIKSDTNGGQTFSFTSGGGTYNVTHLSFQMRRDSDAVAQNLTVFLRTSWNGPDLASASISSTALSTSMSWQSFDISDVTLNDGTTYYIRITSDTMDGKIWLGDDSFGTYSAGDKLDVNGLPLGGEDIAFRVVEETGGNVAPSDLETTATTDGGLSLNEDGGNDAYLIADDGGAILGGLTALTAEVRFSMDSFPNSTNFFSYATASDDNVFKFNIRDLGALSVSINSVKIDSAAMDYRTLADGQQHTLSVTWNSTGGVWEMFVDGVSVDSGSGLETGVTLAGGGTLVIGNDQDSVDGGYDPAAEVAATLYDARIFNYVRTSTEIGDNYYTTLPGSESGMVANWTFNDLSTSGVVTDTVSGNNLTVKHASGAGFVASTPVLTLEIDENVADGTVVGTATGIDADGDSLTYSLTDDAGGRFTIDTNTGVITVADGSLLDYETNTSHNITVRVSDSSAMYDEVYTIDVKNLAEGVIVVDTTNDTLDGDTDSLDTLLQNKGADGVISLREAIEAANNTTGTDTINFNILDALVSGAHTINVLSALPDITDAVIIDGTSEPDFGSTPIIELDGSSAGSVDGLRLISGSDGSTIRGLVINQFGSQGIEINNSDGNTIAGNYIGTDVTGTVDLGNGSAGIYLFSAQNNIIGGTTTADRNLISGNQGSGILRQGSNGGNLIQGNYIGTDATGTLDLGNTQNGIAFAGSGADTIGGAVAGAGNLISGNNMDGISIGVGADGVTIQGNIIGLNAAGTGTIANTGDGISLSSNNNQVGGTTALERNIISGNIDDGIQVAGTGNIIEGNYIGTDITGTVDLGNSDEGIELVGATNTIIGGSVVGAGNVIAGNTSAGIRDENSTGTIIKGNYIGVDVTGTATISNSFGIQTWSGSSNGVIGGSGANEGNVIGGNINQGILLYSASGYTVQGNYIGTDSTGTLDLGNLGNGIVISSNSTNHLIGGTGAGEGNIVAFNDIDGIAVSASTATGNSILGNQIYSNTGLGIDLIGGTEDGFGVTANDAGDADTGANLLQNYPVLSTVTTTGSEITVIGSLNGEASTTFRIEFFASSAADGSTYGEAERYLGYATVTTDGAGNATINSTLTVSVAVGEFLTATATVDLGGGNYSNTSEFAQNVTAISNSAPVNTVPGAQTIDEDTALAISGISVNDPEGNLSTVQLSVTNGTLNVTLSGATTISAGANGTNTLTLSGSQADINATLASLTYQSNLNFNGSDTLTVTSTDTNSATDVDTVAITVNAINDDPTNTGSLPTDVTVTEDVMGFVDLSSVILSDVDVGNALITVTLSTSTGGNLWASSDFDVIVFGSGTGILTLQGGVADLNNFFSSPTRFQYLHGTAHTNGDNADTIQIVVNDGGNTGSGGGGNINLGTVNVDITTVNDAPVISSDGGGATAGVNVMENGTAVTTVTSTDVDGGTAVYTITGGLDAAKFSINSSTGELIFQTAPDYEAPTDSNGDNVYEVTVQVSDGNGGLDTQAISVTVTDQAITTVSATGASSIVAGSSYTLNLSADEDATSWVINWGDGTIETVGGNPSSVTHTYAAGYIGLTLDISVSATDASGTVFNNDLIAPTTFLTGEGLYRYDGSGGSFTQTFSGGELTNPYVVMVGPDGLLYVGGHTSDNVVRYDATTGAYVDTFIAAGSGGLDAAAGLAFGPDGHLYVSSQVSDEILKYDGTTGAFLGTFVTTGSGGVDAPTAIEFRPDGYLYVTSYSTNSVLRYDAITGAFVDTFVTAGSGGLSGPGGMTWGPDGNLYIGGTNSVIKRFDGTTGAFIDDFVTIGLGGLGESIGLTFGPDGHLYVASYTSDQIIKYDGTTGALIGDYIVPGDGGLDGPTTFTFLPNQQVTVLDPAPQLDLDANDSSGTGGTDFDASWTEDAGPVAIADVDAVLTDVDSINLTSLTVTITNLLDGATEVLAADTGGTSITANYNSSTGVLTLSGTDTVAMYQQVLRTITYDNSSDTPNTTSRIITFVANDGSIDSKTATTTVAIAAVNDTPVNTVPGAQVVLEDTALAISGISVNDVDGNLSTVQLSVTNGTLNVTLSGSATISAGANGSNTLTLSGTQTDINATLASLNYQGNLNYVGSDTLTVLSTDSNAATDSDTVAITVNQDNDAPVVTASGGATSYTEQASATVIDGSLTLVDPDGFDGADPSDQFVAVVQITGNYEVADILGFTNTAKIQGNLVGDTLTLTVIGGQTATIAEFEAALRTVTFSNGSDTPSELDRTITFSFDDGVDSSNFSTKTVQVTAVNDQAVADLNGADGITNNFSTTFTEGAGAVNVTDTDATVSDVDNITYDSLDLNLGGFVDGSSEKITIAGYTFTYGTAETVVRTVGTTDFEIDFDGSGFSIQRNISGEMPEADLQTFIRSITYENISGVPTVGDRTIDFLPRDGNALIGLTSTSTITVAAVNDAPVLDLDADDSSGQSGADYAATFTEDGGPVGVADADASLSDVDSVNLTSMNVTITNLQDGAAEVLAADTSGTSIVANYNPGTGLLTLIGPDTVANFQQVLGTITYDNSSQSPDTTARVITFQATDGTNPSNVGTTILTIMAANDAPVNTVPGAQVVAEDTALAISGLSVNDVEGNLSTVQLAVTQGTMTVTLSGGATISAGANGTNTLTLSGSQADINATLASLSYQGNLNYNGADTLTITSTDSNSATDVDVVGITVTAVNDEQSLDINSGLTLNEGTQDTITNAMLSTSDVEQTTNQIVYTITADSIHGTIRLNTPPLGVGSTFTQADIDGGLLSYQDTDIETTSDSFSFSVDDGLGSVTNGTFTITVNPVNDAPTISNLGSDSLAYTEGDGAVVIEQGANALVSDVDSANFDTGTLTVSFQVGSDSAEDVLAIQNQGTGVGQIGVSGSTITYQGVTIGTFTGGTGGTDLVITLNANANATAVSALVQNITYENTDPDNLTTGSRTVRYVLTDGDGGTSTNYDTTVTVSGQNDAPILTTNLPLPVPEESTQTITAAYLSVTDVDNSTTQIIYTLTSLPSGGTVRLNGITLGLGDTFTQDDINNNRVTYRDSDDGASTSFSFTISDGTDVIGPATFTINGQPINDAPVNTVPGTQTVLEETQTAIVGLSVVDVDAAGGLITTQLQVTNGVLDVTLAGTATISAGANGSADLTIQGTVADINTTLASLLYTGNMDVTGIAADMLTMTTDDGGNTGTGGALQDSDNVQIDITNVNDAPVNTVPGAQVVAEDTAIGISGLSVTDVDGNLSTVQLAVTQGTLNVTLSGSATISAGGNGTNTLTLSGSQADINATLASLSYQGNLNYTGPDTLTMTSTDSNAATDVDVVGITVTGVNDAPVNTVPGAQVVAEDTAIAISLLRSSCFAMTLAASSLARSSCFVLNLDASSLARSS